MLLLLTTGSLVLLALNAITHTSLRPKKSAGPKSISLPLKSTGEGEVNG